MPVPLFSIVIPTYNRRELLEATLRSVWAQDSRDYEVIVVDDGSTDGTREFLAGQADRLVFIAQEHRGPGVARNAAIARATGEYVAFLDSDDLLMPWALSTYAAVIARETRPAFICGAVRRFSDPAGLEGVQPAGLDAVSFRDYFASGDRMRWYGMSSFVLRREAVVAAGGFTTEPINGEDFDLALRVGEARGFVEVRSPVTVGYREHAGGFRHVADKTLATLEFLWQQERQGRYPGGTVRSKERWRILTIPMRSNSVACLRGGQGEVAWRLYRRSFGWHLALGRWKYLLGFPVMALFTRARA
ncbi:MAG: glycosyltransferase family 2 protein [Steroidobacteraceae bacterium]